MTTILFSPILWAKVLLKNLWLSVSSVEFYQDVFKVYEGYGIKFILTISFLSSFLCSVVLLKQIVEVKDYFTDNIVSNNMANVDHIISQFPDLNYDGQNISSDYKDHVFLTNINNHRVVAIDPNNKLSYAERNRIPVILSSGKIIISLIGESEKPYYTTSLDYNKVFGGASETINQTLLKARLADVFKNAPEVFIYLFFPIIGVLIFLNAIVEKSFIIIIMYLLANIFMLNVSLKSCIRMVLFASGLFFLFQPLILLVFPALNPLIWIVQIWSNLLMIIAMIKVSKRL